jgi:CubicO group peptidase (beta-lactamase class C family)
VAYWPEFARNGKDHITVEQLVTHKAGVVLLDRSVKISELHNHDALSTLLEHAKPMWKPGKKHGYHSATIGLFMQQLVRRIDKKGRTIGQYFAEEIAEPLGVDFYMGLPKDFDASRLATLKMFAPPLALLNLNKSPQSLRKRILNPFSLFWKTMTLIQCDVDDPVNELTFEEVSGGGAGEARALAKVYGLLATGGKELGIAPETLNIMRRYTDPPEDGIQDAVMGWKSLGSSAGYTKPYDAFNFAGDSAFGFSGTGGSLAYADPEYKVGYAYVMNNMGYYNINDPREVALRETMYTCINRKEKS